MNRCSWCQKLTEMTEAYEPKNNDVTLQWLCGACALIAEESQ